jgi:hypothetical protein
MICVRACMAVRPGGEEGVKRRRARRRACPPLPEMGQGVSLDRLLSPLTAAVHRRVDFLRALSKGLAAIGVHICRRLGGGALKNGSPSAGSCEVGWPIFASWNCHDWREGADTYMAGGQIRDAADCHVEATISPRPGAAWLAPMDGVPWAGMLAS